MYSIPLRYKKFQLSPIAAKKNLTLIIAAINNSPQRREYFCDFKRQRTLRSDLPQKTIPTAQLSSAQPRALSLKKGASRPPVSSTPSATRRTPTRSPPRLLYYYTPIQAARRVKQQAACPHSGSGSSRRSSA